MHDEACVATRVKGEQSAELLDLRMACLAERRGELRALVDTFAAADDSVIEHATQAAQSLSDVDACADVTALRAPPPPRDPATRARIDGARELIARARALEAAGKYADVLGLAEASARDAAAIGYAPLQADALLALGRARFLEGDYPGARDALFDGVVAAEAGRSDRAAAEAWIELMNVRAKLDAFHEAHESDRLAAAAIERLGADDALTARRSYMLGVVLNEEGKYEEALAQFRGALDRMTRVLGDAHVEVAGVLDSIGYSLRQLDRYDEAIASYRRALAILERELGPSHPRVAKTLQNLSARRHRQGRLRGGARGQQPRARHQEGRLRHRQPRGRVGLRRLRERARRPRALRGGRRRVPSRARPVRAGARPEAPGVARAVRSGRVVPRAGAPDEALVAAQRVARHPREGLRPRTPRVGAALIALGDATCAAGRCAQAVPIAERGLAVAEAAFSSAHVQTAEALRALGAARLGAHDAAHAVPPLERAYALYRGIETAPSERAECAFALARALWDAGGDRARAVELAEEARKLDAAAGPQTARALEDVERWRGAHRGK